MESLLRSSVSCRGGTFRLCGVLSREFSSREPLALRRGGNSVSNLCRRCGMLHDSPTAEGFA
eukprot:3781991-Pyramimonas_sp.AAC.1